MKNSLIWFKTNLRIHDNPAITAATSDKNNTGGSSCVGVYVLDPKELKPSPQVSSWGMEWARMGPHRAQFLYESLIDLKENLKAIGSDLIVKIGKPEEVIYNLIEELDITQVITCEEVCTEELETMRRVASAINVPLKTTTANVVFPPLKHKDATIFSPFKRLVTKNHPQKPERPEIHKTLKLSLPKLWEKYQDSYTMPNLQDFGGGPKENYENSSFPWKGGETTALKRAEYYNENTKGILNYRATRNNLSGEDFSTKFSAWLAQGCISARLVYDQAEQRGNKEKKSYAVQKFLDEMIWREFFRHVAKTQGGRFFKKTGIQNRVTHSVFNKEKFDAWKNGETKSPLVNAFMRELSCTGFMSNRGRQIVASYLIHDLNQPWTAGAWWFQHALIDFDPSQNWGNWLHASGVGTDPVPQRRFNPYLQAQKFDPDGIFQRTWGTLNGGTLNGGTLNGTAEVSTNYYQNKSSRSEKKNYYKKGYYRYKSPSKPKYQNIKEETPILPLIF